MKMNESADYQFFKSFTHDPFNDTTSCSMDDPSLVYAHTDFQTKPSNMIDTTSSQSRAISSSSSQDDARDSPQAGIQDGRQEGYAPSLYLRLKSLFHHKDKPAPLPTPPASPQSYRPPVLDATPLSPTHKQSHLPTICDSPHEDSREEPNLPQWTPLTPESIDHRRTRGSGSLPSLVRLVQDLASSGEGQEIADQLALEQGLAGGGQQLLDNLEEATCAQLDSAIGPGLGLELSPHISERAEVVSRTQEYFSEHDEGVHLREEEHWPGRSRTQSIQQWGKSRAPPIRWDILIDDLSSAVTPGCESTFDRSSQRHGIVYSYDRGGGRDEEDFYGLQYALELSRRDRRKIMDSDPNSAGEYSKSRDAWATLHFDRVMPAHQEYWFRYWVQWHSRLDEKVALKLARCRKKEENKRYHLIDPWPTTDRRIARHPRRADEDLHPNLRLMRHRTRSAPGRIRK